MVSTLFASSNRFLRVNGFWVNNDGQQWCIVGQMKEHFLHLRFNFCASRSLNDRLQHSKPPGIGRELTQTTCFNHFCPLPKQSFRMVVLRCRSVMATARSHLLQISIPQRRKTIFILFSPHTPSRGHRWKRNGSNKARLGTMAENVAGTANGRGEK